MNHHRVGIGIVLIVVGFISLSLAMMAFALRHSLTPSALPSEKPRSPVVVGGDRDAHGCIGSAGYSWCGLKNKCLRPWEESCSVKASFRCGKGVFISAEFESLPKDQVTLKLDDGRALVLPRAISADGGRYANFDESVVFWNKGDTAFLTENGKETYSGCRTVSK